MSKYKVGDHLVVKLLGGRIVEATVKAGIEMTNGACACMCRLETRQPEFMWRSMGKILVCARYLTLLVGIRLPGPIWDIWDDITPMLRSNMVTV
jgi:hypothetical protein